jgi:1-deoxy-D-xylulose-5-phosphate reductoisomerase
VKTLSILGSTGSIGESTLDVASRFPDAFRVAALGAAGANPARLAEQVSQTGARLVSVADAERAATLRPLLPPGVELCWGAEGLVRVAELEEVDLVVSAVVGAAGLVPTYAALTAGKDVALANKESLVVGGELVLGAARKSGARLLPVDSEHSALFQVLDGRGAQEVRRLILTASGGPFRGCRRADLAGVSVEQTLAHPNWAMGPKISVDSATLMNKGLEVIEAYWLFGVPASAIEVTVHPQSVVHSMVEFVDGAVLAQLGVPDMRGPIAFALNYPARLPMPDLGLNLWEQEGLTFEPPDREGFPCLDLAFQALERGGTAPAALSGANEVAVAAFLDHRIGFLQIPELVAAVLETQPVIPLDTVHTALEADLTARHLAGEWVAVHGRGE